LQCLKHKKFEPNIEQNSSEALFIGTDTEHDSALIGIARIKREDEWVEVPMYSYDELISSFTEQFRGDSF